MPRTAVNSQGTVVYNYSELTNVVSDVWMDKVIEPRLIKTEKIEIIPNQLENNQ